MNKLITIVGALVLVSIFAFYMCSYQVRFNEIAFVKSAIGQTAKAKIISEPGLYYKMPWPFQSVVITDNRIRVLQDTYEETQTKDSQNILVTVYVCWRVDKANPYLYHISSSSDRDAESKLKSLVQSQKKAIISSHHLKELVNTDPEQFKFAQVEDELKAGIAQAARDQYGIEVLDVGIRRLSFPQAVSEQVFARMKKNEEAKAAKYKTEGEAEARDIRAKASAATLNIMAVTNRLAQNIESQANVEVAEYYKEFNKNVELRLFLDQLKASREVLKERTTLVLDSVMAPFGLVDLDKLKEKTSRNVSSGNAEPRK